MADLSELPLGWRLFLKAYRWRKLDPVPRATLRRPLSQSKIALLSSAGMVMPGQAKFDDAVAGGDWGYREIADSVRVETLVECHRSQLFDRSGIESDRNLAFPIDRLHELVKEGFVGAANQRHFSVMGSLTAPGRLIARSAPRIADALLADAVDAVLLVPI